MSSVPRPVPVVVVRPAALGTPAGIASRTVASGLDAVLVLAAVLVGYLAVSATLFLAHPRRFSFPAPSLAVEAAAGMVLACAYLTVCWATSGETYGDHVLGLRVVTRRGTRLPVRWALLRAAAYVLVPFGLVWAAVDRRHRSLQDLVFRTSVIYDWD